MEEHSGRPIRWRLSGLSLQSQFGQADYVTAKPRPAQAPDKLIISRDHFRIRGLSSRNIQSIVEGDVSPLRDAEGMQP
jgi:hypothetical protein